MKRRDFLKLIGVAAAAPSLVVKEAALAGQKFDGEIIPTGFPIVDETIGGGIRRRGLHTIHGDEPQMFGESLAMRLGEKASVALLTPFNHCCNPSFSSYHGDVTVFPIPYNYADGNMQTMDYLMKSHDVIVLLNDNLSILNGHAARFLRMLADKENCAIVWVNICGELLPLGLIYMSDVLLSVQSQGTTDREAVQWDDQFQYHFGRLHCLCLTKNRWGKTHVVEPIILNDGIGFRPMCETNYWSYDPRSGIICGPWGKPYGTMVRPSINEVPTIRRIASV
jgi:hypothetical protein